MSSTNIPRIDLTGTDSEEAQLAANEPLDLNAGSDEEATLSGESTSDSEIVRQINKRLAMRRAKRKREAERSAESSSELTEGKTALPKSRGLFKNSEFDSADVVPIMDDNLQQRAPTISAAQDQAASAALAPVEQAEERNVIAESEDSAEIESSLSEQEANRIKAKVLEATEYEEEDLEEILVSPETSLATLANLINTIANRLAEKSNLDMATHRQNARDMINRLMNYYRSQLDDHRHDIVQPAPDAVELGKRDANATAVRTAAVSFEREYQRRENAKRAAQRGFDRTVARLNLSHRGQQRFRSKVASFVDR